MNNEVQPGREKSPPSSRTECYLACNYAVLNTIASSHALAQGPLSIMWFEQKIARGVAADYPELFDHITDPLERGRLILRDSSVNCAVTEPEDITELGMLFDAVDKYFDLLEENEWRQLSGQSGTLDY